MSAKSNRLFPILASAAALAVVTTASTAATAAEEDGTDPMPPDITEETSGAGSQEPGSDASSGQPPLGAPVVQTRVEHGQAVTEYRRQGRVFMMTVEPRIGPKQYWNDPDGDGQFQRRTSPNLDENVNLPKWRLGGW